MKRFHSILTAIIMASMLLALFPADAFAQGEIPPGVTENPENHYVYANGNPIVIKETEETIEGNVVKNTYIYDIHGETKLFDKPLEEVPYVFGGAQSATVANTKVVMESGRIGTRTSTGKGYLYGGGGGDVEGTAEVIVRGGFVGSVYGCGTGTTGRVKIEYNNTVSDLQALVVGGKGKIRGNVDIVLNDGCVRGDTKVVLVDSVAKGLYAGTGGDERVGCPGSDVMGNASYTLVGGMAESLYGGCKSGVVRGTSTITLEGQVVMKKVLDAQGKGGVLGGATVTVPENFVYMDKIEQGKGIDIQLTAPVPKNTVPGIGKRTEEVLSTEGEEGKLVFRFIDLPPAEGQMTGRSGEAIFIHLPNGETMLVDAAETFTAEHLVDVLKRMRISRIDHLVASHYHSDHIGGMTRILDEFDVGTLYKPGFDVKIDKDYYTDLKARIDDPSRTFSVKDLWRGDQLEIGGLHIEVLHPLNSESIKDIMSGNASIEDHNNNSIVLKMTFGENTALLTGDIYMSAELELLKEFGAKGLKADLLKVPHHGDTTSSGPEFVAAVRPEIAVMDHFSETLIVNNRYRAIGADTYVTGKDGIVKVSFDGRKHSAEVLTEYFEKPVIVMDEEEDSFENAGGGQDRKGKETACVYPAE